jgi:hypothetical protein
VVASTPLVVAGVCLGAYPVTAFEQREAPLCARCAPRFVIQVLRILWRIGVKAMVQGKLDREAARERGRQETVERFRAAMRGRSDSGGSIYDRASR